MYSIYIKKILLIELIVKIEMLESKIIFLIDQSLPYSHTARKTSKIHNLDF